MYSQILRIPSWNFVSKVLLVYWKTWPPSDTESSRRLFNSQSIHSFTPSVYKLFQFDTSFTLNQFRQFMIIHSDIYSLLLCFLLPVFSLFILLFLSSMYVFPLGSFVEEDMVKIIVVSITRSRTCCLSNTYIVS